MGHKKRNIALETTIAVVEESHAKGRQEGPDTQTV